MNNHRRGELGYWKQPNGTKIDLSIIVNAIKSKNQFYETLKLSKDDKIALDIYIEIGKNI